MTTQALTALTLLSSLALLVGCDTQEATPIPRDTGSQSAQRASGVVQADAASSVQAYSLMADGSLRAEGSAQVEADGQFTVEFGDTDAELGLIEALDERGQVVGQVVVESLQRADAVVTTPIDAESTVEAQVFLEAVASAGSTTEVVYADLRARIDASVAAAAMDAQDTAAAIDALALSTHAALETQLAALADSGDGLTASALAELYAQASLDLTAELHAAAMAGEPAASGDAEAAFLAELGAALEAHVAGSDAEAAAQAAEAMALASLAASETLAAAEGEGSALWSSAVLVYGEHQAWLSARAIELQADATGATELDAQGELSAALDTLIAEAEAARASGDVDAMLQAWADLQAAVDGDATADTALELALELSASDAIRVEAARAQAEVLADTLATEIEAAAAQADDSQAAAQATVDAWIAYTTAVEQVSAELSAELEGEMGADDAATLFATLFIQSSGTFAVSR